MPPSATPLRPRLRRLKNSASNARINKKPREGLLVVGDLPFSAASIRLKEPCHGNGGSDFQIELLGRGGSAGSAIALGDGLAAYLHVGIQHPALHAGMSILANSGW